MSRAIDCGRANPTVRHPGPRHHTSTTAIANSHKVAPKATYPRRPAVMSRTAMASSTLAHARDGSRAPTHLCDPPAQPHEKESPIVKKLGRLALEGMTDE